VVLLYALIALVILSLSGLALVRGMGSALGIGGDFALRRDMVNQGELGVATAKAQFLAAGLLGTGNARQASLATANYSATTLATDPNGIPVALLDDTTFTGVGTTGNDIAGNQNLTIRYVIDRQCSVTGAPESNTCMAFQTPCKPGQVGCGGNQQLANGAGRPVQAVYRITVRVIGPKNALTFLQTTIGA
jgi:hypothetical protein